MALDAPVFQGEGIIVTASRADISESTTIITGKELELLGAKNVGDALRYTFGTSAKTTGPLGSQISGSIRGVNSQQMLVLVDGARINSPLLGGYDLGDLPVMNIERIEIVRGPSSASYGADAVGGVINIITKNGKDNTEIFPQISEKGANGLSITCSRKFDKAGFVITADQEYSPGDRENSDCHLSDLSGKLTYDPDERTALSGGFETFHAIKGVAGSLTFPTPTTRQEDDNLRLFMQARTKVNDVSDLDIKFSQNELNQLYDADPDNAPIERYSSISRQFEAQNRLKLFDSDLFTYGGEYRVDRSGSDLAGNHIVDNTAIFVQEQHELGTGTGLYLSARQDSHSVSGQMFSPRAGIVASPFKDTSIRLSYGEAYRAPTLNDLFAYYVDPTWGIISRGNPKLKPEKARSSELGISQKINGNCEINANYFMNDVTDLIQWIDISGTWMTWEAQNVASARTSGYELGLKYDISESLEFKFNYTALEAIDGETGKYLPYRPREQHNSELLYSGNGIEAGVNVVHIGRRFDDIQNTKIVDPYTVVGLKLEGSISSDIKVMASVENLFNEDYQDTLDYPMPGRRYTFGIRYCVM
jgi:outer membrane receptor for ferrienterochelin and colicins